MSLAEQAQSAFSNAFQYTAAAVFHAPGRVNLIGEHTDYNDGFVLPAAINFGTVIAASLRDDQTVRVCAANFDNEVIEFSLEEPIQRLDHSHWSNYVRGVAKTLIDEGYKLHGVDLSIIGDVPYGAGLSSSAALEVVLIRTFVSLAKQSIDPTDAALLGQKTENEFIGAQTGIMDQLISARGQQDHALLIDCRSLETEAFPLDPQFKIVIFNSNVKRGLVDSEYNTRRQQCTDAAKLLDVKALRDAKLEDLNAAQDAFDEVTFRRAKHVITENDRTEQAARALSEHNWIRFAELMVASHESMKNDFEITVPPIDRLVDLINSFLPDGAGGARMTGGGFGGCVVSIVHIDHVDAVIEHVASHYEAEFGLKETVYICDSVDGAFVAQ